MTTLTPKAVAFLASEEGLVLEAYKDSVNVWTWALGVTNASGHQVYPRYLDKPQTLERCLEVSVWLIQNKYLPAVLKAFDGHDLTEAQLAAALSWHWNTGAILKTDWVKMVRDGKPASARQFMVTHYLNNGMLTDRRKREAALFFDGAWPSPMLCPVYPIKLPSHTPDWRRGVPTDLLPALQQAMGGS